MTATMTDKASALHAKLLTINLKDVPSSNLDRCAPRTEQAAAARKLFSKLGIKGISVTTPNYSMASSVDVRLPRLSDDAHDRSKWPHSHEATEGLSEDRRCPACKAHATAEKMIDMILARAFPNHDDRSDSQSDHFDYCWSVK